MSTHIILSRLYFEKCFFLPSEGADADKTRKRSGVSANEAKTLAEQESEKRRRLAEGDKKGGEAKGAFVEDRIGLPYGQLRLDSLTSKMAQWAKGDVCSEAFFNAECVRTVKLSDLTV